MRVAANGGSLVNLIGLPLLLGSFFLAMGSFIGCVADGFDLLVLLVGVLATLLTFSDYFFVESFASGFNLRVWPVFLLDLTASSVMLLALTVLPVFLLVTILNFREMNVKMVVFAIWMLNYVINEGVIDPFFTHPTLSGDST
jgi:hypothetical protein